MAFYPNNFYLTSYLFHYLNIEPFSLQRLLCVGRVPSCQNRGNELLLYFIIVTIAKGITKTALSIENGVEFVKKRGGLLSSTKAVTRN